MPRTGTSLCKLVQSSPCLWNRDSASAVYCPFPVQLTTSRYSSHTFKRHHACSQVASGMGSIHLSTSKPAEIENGPPFKKGAKALRPVRVQAFFVRCSYCMLLVFLQVGSVANRVVTFSFFCCMSTLRICLSQASMPGVYWALLFEEDNTERLIRPSFND